MEIEDPEETKSSVELINSDFTSTILVSIFSWTLGYFALRRLLSSKTPEYSCRLITLVHGLVASTVGMNQCFLNENPFEHPDWITNDTQNILLIFSLGYFIFDLTWCSYYRTETRLMIMHHIYSIYTLKGILSKGYSGAQASCSIGCMEITNPLLQLRWFLRSEGYHKTLTFFFVEVSFFILFFTFRLIIGSYILLTVLFENNDIDFKIASILLYFISAMFMVQIIKYATLKYKSKRQFQVSQVELTNQDTS